MKEEKLAKIKCPIKGIARRIPDEELPDLEVVEKPRLIDMDPKQDVEIAKEPIQSQRI